MFKILLLLGAISVAGLSGSIWSRVQHSDRSSTDAAIQSDLESRLAAFSQSGNLRLRVTAAHGTVKLEGRMASQYDHDALLRLVKEGAGTNKVIDNLLVSPGR